MSDAVAALLAGKPVILPTDTVYGLCALADRAEPTERLYELKGRDSRQPTALLAHVLDLLLERLPELRGRGAAIARALLPGPYTLILPNPARRFHWITGSNPDAIGGLGRVLTAMGRYDEAIAESSSANAMFSGLSIVEADIAQAELGAGRVLEARRRIARLEAQASDASSRVSPNALAVAYARLDKDQAFAWLERSFQVKGGGSVWLKVDPRFDRIREEPRFQDLMRRVGLI